MRKFVAIACLLVLGLAAKVPAQHYVGVRGGYGSGSIRLFPPTETGSLWGLYNGGVSWKYYSRERFVGGIEMDLQFIQKGYTHPLAGTPDTVYVHQVNSVELPFFWQPHMYVMGRKMRIFLNAGVVLSYNIDARERQFSKTYGEMYPWRDYPMKLTRDNRWGYGLCGGFGFNYIMDRFELLCEGRYNIGYADIYRNHNKNMDNPWQRSPMDNIYFSVGLYYRFGPGILAAPSKSVAAKMAEREKARIERGAAKAPPAAEPPEPPAIPADTTKIQKNGLDTPAQGSATDTEGPR